MINILENYEKNQIEKLSAGKPHPKFNPGDTLKVHLKVKEGEKERIQVFEGVCIAKKNAGINSSFTVRKISYGEGIERVLPLFSPQISKIELAKQGDVRRSKLYYLRQRSGKSARISEKNTFTKNDTNLSENKKTNDTPSDKKAIDKSDTSNSANEKIVQKASVNTESSKSEGEK
jgi:large subunit ribosomal protein L19